jgi:hypothetical protein
MVETPLQMIYHVWKDQASQYLFSPSTLMFSQGWKGSAETRPLVLAIRDYFIERVEQSKLPPLPVPKDTVQKRTSTVQNEDDEDDDDLETYLRKPLPDSWMTAYLQVKRLRYLHRQI